MGTLYARLAAKVSDADTDCWHGVGGTCCRYGYRRLNTYIPGLKAKRQLTAHIATWLCVQLNPQAPWEVSTDDLFLAYCEFRASGLELNHTCHNTGCRNPAHLQPMTHAENCRERTEWYRALRDARPDPQPQEDEDDIPF